MSDPNKESTYQNTSRVLATSPADLGVSYNHFLSKLSFETDPSDVNHDITNKISGVLVLDARIPESYARGNVPGAINMPHRTIDSITTALLPRDKVS